MREEDREGGDELNGNGEGGKLTLPVQLFTMIGGREAVICKLRLEERVFACALIDNDVIGDGIEHDPCLERFIECNLVIYQSYLKMIEIPSSKPIHPMMLQSTSIRMIDEINGMADDVVEFD